VRNHSRPKSHLNRRKPSRNQRITMLIVCEGEKTEPNYFRGFRVAEIHNVDINIHGTGYNTLSLVNEAIRLKEQQGFDSIWCVFDKDDFSNSDFNSAISKAHSNGFSVAYSNQSFELWYILHYKYLTSDLHRDRYCKLLSKCLGFPYKKNDRDTYQRLLSMQETAIANSEKLLQSHSGNPATNSPSTTVHLLVKALNGLISDRR
jgi:RloB-like protein